MKLTLEPTAEFELVDGVACRVWTGTSDGGVPVKAWISCVSPQTHEEGAQASFGAALRELPPPARDPVCFDVRFIA